MLHWNESNIRKQGASKVLCPNWKFLHGGDDNVLTCCFFFGWFRLCRCRQIYDAPNDIRWPTEKLIGRDFVEFSATTVTLYCIAANVYEDGFSRGQRHCSCADSSDVLFRTVWKNSVLLSTSSWCSAILLALPWWSGQSEKILLCSRNVPGVWPSSLVLPCRSGQFWIILHPLAYCPDRQVTLFQGWSDVEDKLKIPYRYAAQGYPRFS